MDGYCKEKRKLNLFAVAHKDPRNTIRIETNWNTGVFTP